MYYTIYKVTNIFNGKFYIGKHQSKKLDDGYLGSGRLLVKAIKKYGRDSFHKDILFIFDNEQDMNLKEKELVTEEFILQSNTYNTGVGGEGGPQFKGKRHSIESKRKIGLSSKGRIIDANARKKISENNRKRVITDSFRKKMSEIAKNRKKSEVEKKKIGDAARGRILSETVNYQILISTEDERPPNSTEYETMSILDARGKN